MHPVLQIEVDKKDKYCYSIQTEKLVVVGKAVVK